MKRTELNLTPMVITADGAEGAEALFAIQQRVVDAIMAVEEVETVVVRRAGPITEARGGYCVPGEHDFVVDHHFPDDRPVPPVCRSHAYAAAIAEAEAEHRPLFDAVRERTGLEGHIWQSGGMTMTIQIPLPGAVDSYPCYLGLKEGETPDGQWQGSVGFYATSEIEEGETVVNAYDEPLRPETWALLIEDDYTKRPKAEAPAADVAAVRGEDPPAEDIRHLRIVGDGKVITYPPDPADDEPGRMYVLDVLGLRVLVHDRTDTVFVHVDTTDSESARPEGKGVSYEINGNGENPLG